MVTGRRHVVVGGGTLAELFAWAEWARVPDVWLAVSPRSVGRLRGFNLRPGDRVHWAPGVTAEQFHAVSVCAATVPGGVPAVAGAGWGVHVDADGPRS